MPKSYWYENYIIILLYLKNNEKIVKIYIIINFGITNFRFIDERFAISHGFSFILLEYEYKLKIFFKNIAQSKA